MQYSFPILFYFIYVIEKQGVCHTVALPFINIKKYLKGKRRIMETQIFYYAKI